jgi:hypothetical protein
MQPSELEFYQDLSPALIDSGWEWSDHQTFLSSMAIRKLEDISYRGLKDEKFVCVSVHYHNNGTQCKFRVQIRKTEYPSFVYDDWVSVDAYKAKVLAISNMNGDALLEHIKNLSLKNIYAMKSHGGSDVVNLHLYANTDVKNIEKILLDECIPFVVSDKQIECSGKLNRIKREHDQLRLSNASRPWFPVDRSIRDSF